jgi:hypothetical protein
VCGKNSSTNGTMNVIVGDNINIENKNYVVAYSEHVTLPSSYLLGAARLDYMDWRRERVEAIRTHIKCRQGLEDYPSKNEQLNQLERLINLLNAEK